METSESIVINFHGDELTEGKFITFPKRVRVKSMQFTIDTSLRGAVEDDRLFELGALIGHPQPTPENQFNDTSWNVFGDNPKPVVSIPDGQSLVSTIGETPLVVVENPKDIHSNVELTYGILEPGDFLWVVFQYSGTFDPEFDWAAATAVVTVSYEETTDKSVREMIAKYPFLD